MKKRMRREALPAEMDLVVPWARLEALIEPHYPKKDKNGGCPIMSLSTMLRECFLQNWYALSDRLAEERLYDSSAVSPRKNTDAPPSTRNEVKCREHDSNRATRASRRAARNSRHGSRFAISF